MVLMKLLVLLMDPLHTCRIGGKSATQMVPHHLCTCHHHLHSQGKYCHKMVRTSDQNCGIYDRQYKVVKVSLLDWCLDMVMGSYLALLLENYLVIDLDLETKLSLMKELSWVLQIVTASYLALLICRIWGKPVMHIYTSNSDLGNNIHGHHYRHSQGQDFQNVSSNRLEHQCQDKVVKVALLYWCWDIVTASYLALLMVTLMEILMAKLMAQHLVYHWDLMMDWYLVLMLMKGLDWVLQRAPLTVLMK